MSDYTQSVVTVRSSSEISDKRDSQENKDFLSSLLLTGSAGTGGYFALKNIEKSEYFQRVMAERKGFRLLDTSIEAADMRSRDFNSWNDMRPNNKFFFSDQALEIIRKVEESSPFKILRTFELSHIITPFSLGEDVDYTMSGRAVNYQRGYLKSLIDREGNVDTNSVKFDSPMRVVNGSLYEADIDGNIGRKLLNSARVVATHYDIPKDEMHHRESYRNLILDKYRDIVGDIDKSSINLKNIDEPQFTFIGSRSKHGWKMDYFRGYTRSAFEKGIRIFDAPLDFIAEYFPESGLSEKLRQYGRINLGTSGDYTKSLRHSLLNIMPQNILKKSFLAFGAYSAADMLSKTVAPEESAYSMGILEGISTSLVNAHIGFAEIWSDNFQGYKESQEQVAEGSTSIMTLAGLPLAAGVALGTTSYLQRLQENAIPGSNGPLHGEHSAYARSKAFKSISSEMTVPFTNFKLNAPEVRWKRRFNKGLVLGAAAMFPFLPGALIGESSENLKSMYSGEEDVAIRANRWWFSGGTEFEGNKIKYFTKHWYARLMAETDTKSLYGDSETKDSMNPFLNPLDYLKNPYALEEMHSEDRPYAVWGMDVSYGSFFGKLYEKTLGSVIKPDIINPEMQKYISENPNSVTGTPSGIVSGEDILFEESKRAEEFNIQTPVSEVEASLIRDGMMLPPANATYEPGKEALSWSYGAMKDFVGLKGWALGMIEEGMGLDLEDISSPQLSRSGEMVNKAIDFRDLNLGGAFGLTESQRRFLPTSSGSIRERVNPIKNRMPSWLPGSDSEFYIDFSTGDPFRKIENGNARLPGAGYESLHEELKGFDPEEYPDIFKYKILSDVALGSKEYYEVKNRIERREDSGELTGYESELLSTIRDQEFQRFERKRFKEYKTDEELKEVSVAGKAINAYWETITHNSETPLEYLTFFRPAGKLIHARTAIEDYKKTQIYGSDVAMWDRPIDHFISPAIDSTMSILGESYIPEQTQDRRAVNEYFDNLEYIKYRNLYKEAVKSGDLSLAEEYKSSYLKTQIGATTDDFTEERDILRSYISLSDEEKAYFTSFSNAKGSDREDILAMTPDNIASIYSKIWARQDVIEAAVSAGKSVKDAVSSQAQQEREELAELMPEEYNQYLGSGEVSHSSFEEYLADSDASEMISMSTGMPDEDFVGWDPRIDLDSVKLKTLSVGKDNMYDYGFWESDMKDLERLIAVENEDQVVNNLEEIKRRNRERRDMESKVEKAMRTRGYDVKSVNVMDSSDNTLTMNLEKTNG